MADTTTPVSALRTVYTVEQFRTEILAENRSAKWVRAEIKRRHIATVAKRPYLIPRSEAIRMMGGAAA